MGGNTYTFDFIHMTLYQINIRTRYKRQIQRVKATSSTAAVVLGLEQDEVVQRAIIINSVNDKEDDHQSKNTETLTIILRGPFDALHRAN